MAYMVYQRYTSAILDGYLDRSDVAEQADLARQWREWLEALAIAPDVRRSLVEQARVIEEAFEQRRRCGGSAG